MKIVEILHDGASSHFLKYYQCVNKQEYKHCLFMDFYPSYQNGNKYIEKNKEIMILYKKFRVLANVAGALRFLKSKGIVHMDLTLNNVLISSADVLPKIIDFGESYSEIIKDKSKNDDNVEYSPGFTNPYGPP